MIYQESLDFSNNLEDPYRDIERAIAGLNTINELVAKDTRSSSAKFGGFHYLVAKSIIAATETHTKFLSEMSAKSSRIVSMDDVEKAQLKRLLVMVTKFEKEMMTPGERLTATVREFGEELKKWHL